MANSGNGYTTGLTILNVSDQTVKGSISYYLTDGTQVVGAKQNFDLAAHASQPIYQGAVANLPQGFHGQAVITQVSVGTTANLIVTTNAQTDSLFFTYTEPN